MDDSGLQRMLAILGRAIDDCQREVAASKAIGNMFSDLLIDNDPDDDPALMARLRIALDLPEGTGIVETLMAAIHRIEG